MADVLMNIYGGARKDSNTAALPREFRTEFSFPAGVPFPPRGNPATLASIPAGFPRIPRDSRDPHPRAGLYYAVSQKSSHP